MKLKKIETILFIIAAVSCMANIVVKILSKGFGSTEVTLATIVFMCILILWNVREK
mgnify:CR=1 FL=1